MKLFRVMIVMALVLFGSVTGYAQEGKVQLLWKSAEDAVRYEFEVTNVPLRANVKATEEQLVYQTTNIVTPGTELDLSLLKNANLKKLYYRVRPMDLERNPIAGFYPSVSLNTGALNTTKPTTTQIMNKNHPAMLYPVYAWIPVLGAARYEVEIMSQLPENPNGAEASRYRIRSYMIEGGFDCYEDKPYTVAGTYYWRVRGLDDNNQPVGTYSDANSFTVKTGRYQWAVFGDSITHGGGAISNPPCDERFEYVSYLPFPVKNLGKSGDTIEMMVERFDSEVLPFRPKYMFVLGGSNSIRGGTSGETVIANLQIIKEKCVQNDIIPIFLTLPPVNPERIMKAFEQPTADNWQVELAKVNNFIRQQTYFVDVYPLLVGADGNLPVAYAQDGLHPDISGKRIMGRAMNNFLRDHSGQKK